MTRYVVDTSAIAAIYAREPDAESLAGLLLDEGEPIVPPTCLVEFVLLHRLGGDRQRWLDHFIELYGVEVPAMTIEISRVAVEAALRYGRGSGHAAKLNFGDCISHAFARHLDLPLLFVGDDFGHTDVMPTLTQRQSG
jgi:ribonuclease VapC